MDTFYVCLCVDLAGSRPDSLWSRHIFTMDLGFSLTLTDSYLSGIWFFNLQFSCIICRFKRCAEDCSIHFGRRNSCILGVLPTWRKSDKALLLTLRALVACVLLAPWSIATSKLCDLWVMPWWKGPRTSYRRLCDPLILMCPKYWSRFVIVSYDLRIDTLAVD